MEARFSVLQMHCVTYSAVDRVRKMGNLWSPQQMEKTTRQTPNIKVSKAKVPAVEQLYEAEVMRPFLERDMVLEL